MPTPAAAYVLGSHVDPNAPAWARPLFEVSEYAERHRRLRAKMAEEGLEFLLVIQPGNLNYLVGYETKSYQDFQCVVFTLDEGPLAMVVRLSDAAEIRDTNLVDEVFPYVGHEQVPPEGEQGLSFGGLEEQDPIAVLQDVLRRNGLVNKRVGFEMPAFYLSVRHFLALRTMLESTQSAVADTTFLVDRLGMIKSPAEIAVIRRAAEMCDRAMEATAAAVVEGKTELEVVGETYRALMASGSDSPASYVNWFPGLGLDTAMGPLRVVGLVKGDFLHVEFGSSNRRYPATIARDMCLGEPTPRMRELHDVQVAACDALIAAAQPGVSTAVPHEAARRVIAEAGLERGFTHSAGYGLRPGFPPMWLEPLHWGPAGAMELKPGMVLTVEPPILLGDEHLGARVIDNILINEDSPEILSAVPRNIWTVG